VGKSFVVCDLIARLTTGGEIPGGKGECFNPGRALILSEDPHKHMLVPRLIESGADRSRVALMTWEAMAKYSLDDVTLLNEAFVQAGRPDLVVIDPPTNVLGEADEHKNAEVRQVVMNVVAWLVENDTACIFILHVNKNAGKGVEALNRVMGSVAWVTTSRIAHTFVRDPDDKTRNLFAVAKTNLGPIAPTLAYRVVKTDSLARVEWLGEVDITADDAMSREPKRIRRDMIARDWLIEQFRKKREWRSEDLFEAGRQENISRNAIFEAKELLKLPKARQEWQPDGERTWIWHVPPDWPPLTAKPGTTGPVGQWVTDKDDDEEEIVE
jgi:hypothetical protein